MRFMMIVKASKQSEAGVMPDETMITEMTRFNEELARAGVLIDLSGLQPTSKGARVHFRGGKVNVTDGPFTEAKELIAGYWIIQVKSLAEAVAWARRAPMNAGSAAADEAEIEIRPFFELSDFPPSEAADRAFALSDKLASKK